MEPIFEADLEPSAYGYRPKRSGPDAVQKVEELLHQGYTDVVDADLSKYFDTIPHSELMQCVARRIVDKHMLHLLKMWVKVPVEEEDETGKKRLTGGKDQDRGTPQGGVVSPLLANLYMNRMLKGWRKTGRAEQFRGAGSRSQGGGCFHPGPSPSPPLRNSQRDRPSGRIPGLRRGGLHGGQRTPDRRRDEPLIRTREQGLRPAGAATITPSPQHGSGRGAPGSAESAPRGMAFGCLSPKLSLHTRRDRWRCGDEGVAKIDGRAGHLFSPAVRFSTSVKGSAAGKQGELLFTAEQAAHVRSQAALR